MALSLYATVREAESGDAIADEFHPASIAFRALGGVGNISVRTDIPMRFLQQFSKTKMLYTPMSGARKCL
jgi:hypothetical protein